MQNLGTADNNFPECWEFQNGLALARDLGIIYLAVESDATLVIDMIFELPNSFSPFIFYYP